MVTSLAQLDAIFAVYVPDYIDNDKTLRGERILRAVRAGLYLLSADGGFAIFEDGPTVHVPWIAGPRGFLRRVLELWALHRPFKNATAYRGGKLITYHGRHTTIRK